MTLFQQIVWLDGQAARWEREYQKRLALADLARTISLTYEQHTNMLVNLVLWTKGRW